MNIVARRLLEDQQHELWVDFCRQHSDCWVHHLMMPSIKEGQHSFLIYMNGELIAICPMLIEDVRDHKQACLLGLALPAPLIKPSIEKKTRLWKRVFQRIGQEYDDLCKRYSLKRISFDFYLPFGVTSTEELRNNYLPVNQYFYMIDLTMDIGEIRSKFSKGHKSNIKAVDDVGSIEWVTKDKIETRESWIDYAKLFEIVPSAYDYYYELFRKGLFEFGLCYIDDLLVSASGFFVYGRNVLYEFSVSIDGARQPAHHYILFSAMQRYKYQGCHVLDLGIMAYSSHLNYIVSSKKESIRLFKSGFSPTCMRRNIVEKFFDEGFFIETMECRSTLLRQDLFGDA